MSNLLIMGTISILGAICSYLFITGRIKIGGLFTGYSFVTALPIILMIVIPVGILDVIIILLRIRNPFEESVAPIILLIIVLEILIISIFTLIKLNLVPAFRFSKEADKTRKLLILDSGKKLLGYCIYGNLIYSVLLLTGSVYFISKNHTTLGYILMHPINSIGYMFVGILLMIFMPFMTLPFYFYATIGFIVVTGFVSMFLIIFIMSVNGVARIIYASKNIRKKSLLYIVLMLFPILNLFYMIKLCRLTKVELYSNDKNYY